MKNHQLFTAEFVVPMYDMLDKNFSEEKMREVVMNALVSDLIDTVIKTPGLSVLTSTDDHISGGIRYRLNVVMVNPARYKELERIIEQTNFIIINEDGEKIRLVDLL